MKIIFSSNKNPHFFTITEYIENALKVEHETVFFDDRSFIIPGRIRDAFAALQELDLRRMNNKLLALVERFKPELFFEAGGHRILPETIIKIKKKGIKTALWTIDPPFNFAPVLKAAVHYDFIFTGGSEALEVLRGCNVKELYFLPFAADPAFHKPAVLSAEERKLYQTDVVFMGTVDPNIYPRRVELLEQISDFNLGVWGPGTQLLAKDSPLIKHLKGEETRPQIWTKIYAAAKIVLCIHYKDPKGEVPCYQVSPRVYEALACGAFLVVDAQPDVFKLFENNKDLVVFNDLKELREILSYYLNRDEERKKIAKHGQETVLKKHTYLHRINTLLDIVMR